MQQHDQQNLSYSQALQAICDRVAAVSQCAADPETDTLQTLAVDLAELQANAQTAGYADAADGCQILGQLVELAVCIKSDFPDDLETVSQLLEFVGAKTATLEIDEDGSNFQCDEIRAFVDDARQRWAHYLDLIQPTDSNFEDFLPDATWENDDVSADDVADAESETVSNTQVEMLLSAVADLGGQPIEEPNDSSDCFDVNQPKPSQETDELAKAQLIEDRELLEAFLDDALRCLASMEQTALKIDELSDHDGASHVEHGQQFCRELHTLKGAAASVGLSGLASELHELESSLQEMFERSAILTSQPLFAAVDRVRLVMMELQGTCDGGPTQNPGPESVSRPATELTQFSGTDDASIRIRAAKLDRLMDMLAELVVLRNRRDSHVGEFNALNDELSRCASRLSMMDDQLDGLESLDEPPVAMIARQSSGSFVELAKDISAVSQGMRDLQKPVSADNSAISRFIRGFRQELMQLRRIPVSGLFQRLQRAARDAANTENKQIVLKLEGENTGLEQEIQEKLFEPLMHVVRNSVSHGIESCNERTATGKPTAGVITLRAFSSAQMLVIEVADDGKGLDYEKLRTRAIAKGLLSGNLHPTNEELASLIFHPGFSTRDQANEVAGRGVGMDIVAKTTHQLHGRIEVESVTGEGTTIRLLIPLRTGIEHVMVFRCDGQLFALPLHSVIAAKSTNSMIGQFAQFSLSSALSLSPSADSNSDDVLILRRNEHLGRRNGTDGSECVESDLAIAVDQLIGPEEVVVRGLPNLLKNHPLFCGVTLSGAGETVLLLDSVQVVEYCHKQFGSGDAEAAITDLTELHDEKPKRALVVDDSLTARKALVKLLRRHHFLTVEVGDGIEAIERLQRESFDLVFTDLDMPRLGGMELMSDIQSRKYSEAPVVVISSRDEANFRTKAMDLGAVDYLAKPVAEKSILKVLENLELTSMN